MLKGFRDFLLRGNIVDLAVAVVLAVAFGAVVMAFATDFVGGLIGVIGGTPDFRNAGVTINNSKIVFGSTLTALIYFVIVAAVIYLFVITPMQKLASLPKEGAAGESPAPTDETILLTEIRDLLREQRRGGV